VQLALRPESHSPSRASKFLAAGVALAGAGVIAVHPVAVPSMTAIQARAVQLAADVTASPAAVYGDLLTNTFTNLSALGTQIAANPLPILSAMIANQEGYLADIGTSFQSAGTAFQKWWESGSRESAPGKELLTDVQTALAAGDLNTAYLQFNRLVLFGIQNTVLPIFTGSIFSTTTTMGIPQQMAQNFADAVGAFFTTGTLVYGAFQSVYAPISGANFEASRALDAVSTALSAGNVPAALTAAVNTPGVVLDALLNGFDYSATQESWAGLFTPKGTRASGGPISQFLITIPAKIAAAITNVITPAPAVASAAAITSTSSPATKRVTLTVKPAPTAVSDAADATQTAAGESATPAAPKIRSAGAAAAGVHRVNADTDGVRKATDSVSSSHAAVAKTAKHGSTGKSARGSAAD
jgi:hypothetical protein